MKFPNQSWEKKKKNQEIGQSTVRKNHKILQLATEKYAKFPQSVTEVKKKGCKICQSIEEQKLQNLISRKKILQNSTDKKRILTKAIKNIFCEQGAIAL